MQCKAKSGEQADALSTMPSGVKCRNAGFTLVETLVVLAISVGLVALMAGLYRSVGQSALALRSGQQEWIVQRQLREQLPRLFAIDKTPLRSIVGRSAEIYLVSWQSRAAATDGKPVMAYYRYDETERALYYHEQPLPPWWTGAAAMYNPERLQSEVRAAPAQKVLTGVEQLAFSYLPGEIRDTRPERWYPEWFQEKPPRLIQLHFSKAGRNYSIWFETRAIDA